MNSVILKRTRKIHDWVIEKQPVAQQPPSGRRRSPSPRTIPKRVPSPSVDLQLEADMNKVKKQVLKVMKARLYLLQQPGPNSFLIGGDSPDNKYKVIIGPQSCTCGKEPYCVHILFVMLRVFQVKESDAMLWARDLKNFEVEGLFKKYHKRVEMLSKQKTNLSETKCKQALQSALPNPLVAGGQSSHVMNAKEEEEVCPICLSDLVDGESMTICREGCENRLHHHCMSVWAEECRRRKEQLNCPLCRTIWHSKRTSSPGKINGTNGTANSTLHLNGDDHGLPRGEVIPDEIKSLAQPWVQLLGSDAIGCLFSRDWKHRESGLRFVSRKAVKILTEKRTTASYMETKWELLRVCASILTHLIADPVYNVYVAALRAFRAIVVHVKCRNHEEITILHQTIQAVIENILIKCADANRRVTIISVKVLLEFVQGEHLTSTQHPANPESHSIQRNMELIFDTINNNNTADGQQDTSQWQWWLGRLVFMKRLFDEHRALLLHATNETIRNFSLPVSPRSEADLPEFLNSLEENVLVELSFSNTTADRLFALVKFCVAGISSRHKKVHKCAVSLLVQCISIASQDIDLFSRIRGIILALKTNVQSVLHRHLSTESQREQADMLNILYEHNESEASTNSSLVDYLDLSERSDEYQEGAAAASSSTPTPPDSPNTLRRKHGTPPVSAYDPRLKCMQQVEADEVAALALAVDKSRKRPEDVIPEQLIPVDDVTLVHVQPSGTDAELANNKNVYLENIHWKKGSLLGTGAFSSCYEAMDFVSGRIMAVKQISFCRNSEDEQARVHEVVLEEIMLLHRLKHPNIVACLGATQHTAHYNIFLEFMSGGSISRLLSSFGKFRESVILSYSRQILQGVAYLHAHHTLHRDLKGANILVDSTGQIVKLSDFGTAARLMAHGTGTEEFSGQLLGTIPYMSPEVLRGEHYGRKCDVWSFGCCIIEMATGSPPWGAEHADNHLALMFKIASATTSPPIPSILGPGLRDLTLRCVEPKEWDRPTADELLRHAVYST